MSSHECVMSLGIFGAPRLDDDALLRRRENPKNNTLKTPLPRHTSCMCPAGPACSRGAPCPHFGHTCRSQTTPPGYYFASNCQASSRVAMTSEENK